MGKGPGTSGSCAAWLCPTAHDTGGAAGPHFPVRCVLLSSTTTGLCMLCTQHHGCKLQQPTSSCEQGLVRSPLCRHVAALLFPPQHSSCNASAGLSAAGGLQIFVVSLIFYEQSQHSTWQHFLTASCYLLSMLPMRRCRYRDICGGSIRIPSLSLSGGQWFQLPALLLLKQAPVPLPGCTTGWQGTEQPMPEPS